MPAGISDKVALVTGAARPRSIGRATAHRLAADGAKVACLDIGRPYDDFPDYPGSSARSHGVVAHDGPLITAVGEAPLEFSRALFLVLGLEDERGIDEWYASFKDVPDARAARHG